jgi:Domain of unknown function DUF29
MAQTIAPKTALYDRDYLQWVKDVDMPQEFNGWERTIREQRRQIKQAVEFSPSLAPLFCQFFDDAFDDALDEVRKEKGYKSIQFPDTWQFSRDIDAMLNIDFWE